MIAYRPIGNQAQFDRGHNDPDHVLVSRAQAGDLQAFDLLMHQHKKRVSRIIFNITKNHSDTEDETQETFLRVYRGISQFRGDSQFTSWLSRIAANQALVCLRKRRRNELSFDHSREDYPFGHDIPDGRFNPEQSYSRIEAHCKLHEELAVLPDRLRFALILRDLQGYSMEEVAKELGITVAAVKSRILRARRRLRNQLGEKGTYVPYRLKTL